MDLTADDWERTPWTYPGTPAPHGGLLRDGDFLTLTPGPDVLGAATIEGTALDVVLAASGVAPTAERQLVVAVGSNASPAVMARKLAADGASTTLPMAAVEVLGLAVGHSAHVSRRGFFAAAPYLRPEAVTRTFASLPDAEQLDVLDRSEPNYVRRTLDPRACPVGVDGGTWSASSMVYDSRWGVLGEPGSLEPWPLLTQEQLFERLAQGSSAFTACVGSLGGGLASVMRRLAADPSLRARVREILQEDGWARPSALPSGHSAG